MEQEQSLTGRLSTFFGRLPGQSVSGFAQEIKALTPADRAWFVAEFNKAGMPTKDSLAGKPAA